MYKLAFLCIAIGLISHGCIIVPIPAPEEPPFDRDNLKPIKIGISTKDDVESLRSYFLSGIRRNGKIYIYAKSQRLFYAEGWFFPGRNELVTVSRIHLLIIQFAVDDVVAAVDICREGDKIANGLFVADDGRSSFKTPRDFTTRGIISSLHTTDTYTDYWDRNCILYDYSTDEKAKLFQAPANKSAIYYFKKKRGRKGDIVLLDLEPTSDCDERGYLYWVVDPGIHTINGFSIDYEPGKIYFIEFDEKKLSFVESNIGSKEIEKRTLIVDRLDLSHY
jgi:hypothetical protein